MATEGAGSAACTDRARAGHGLQLDAVAATSRHVGHALGNLLAGLSLSLELLEASASAEARARYLARCQKLCARLIAYHERLTALGGGVLRAVGPVDTAGLMLDALQDARLESMQVAPHVGPGAEQVLGQASLLREALALVLRASSDATGEGGTLSLRAEAAAGAVVLHVVGEGGPADAGGRESAVTTEADAALDAGARAGTQAALLVACAIVERLHGGRLELRSSAAGGGAAVYLPPATQAP